MRADSLGALPGETSAMRVEEESAEAIVAKKRGKPRERRPKDHETDHSDNLYGLARSLLKRTDAAHSGSPPDRCGAEGRWTPAGGETAGGERDHERRRKQEGAE